MSRSIIIIVAGLVWVGCSKKDTNATSGPTGSATTTTATSGPTGSATPTPTGPSNNAAANAAAAAQAKLKDACSFVPKDAVTRLVPGGKSEGSQFPLGCMVLSSNAGLTVTFDTGPAEGLDGERIPGLGVAAYFQNLDPKNADAYVTVVLGNDDHGTNHNLHVAVDLHDGKNHKDDAIAVARDVLAQLAH